VAPCQVLRPRSPLGAGGALEALAGGPYVVVATTAGAQTAALRARFGAPNVVIEDFIDYDDLFPHVDVFVTNGGFGSVLAAMRHGVPVVGAGMREGKNDINARVGYNRLGVDLRRERPTPARLRAAVRRVLDDPTYAANVAALRAELDSYAPLARIDAALTEATATGGGPAPAPARLERDRGRAGAR
jgi:UDP:flavonoid glycosyltransferase YjiC (YdhE family)